MKEPTAGQRRSGWQGSIVLVKLSEQVEPKMKPSEALAAHRNEIREIVLAHRAVNARVFGSVVHGSDTDESDLDILVDTTPDTTLFDLGAIRYKLRNLLGVQVDVLTPGALPDKFRQTVISEARPV
jgi:predicted nucleotidyltransferase